MTDVIDDLSNAEWDSLPPAEQEERPEPKSGSKRSVEDTEAPYGYTASGRIRKRPLGTRSRKGPSRQKTGTDYRDGINGIFQIAATALAIAGEKNQALLADAVTVTHHGPHVSEALNILAQERPEIAAVLDKILQVGPYGLLLGAITPMFAQIMTNHKIAPPGLLGTVDPETLIRSTMSVADAA